MLSTAAKYPELVKGLVLLNVAGKFADKDEKAPVVSGSDITKEVRASECTLRIVDRQMFACRVYLL